MWCARTGTLALTTGALALAATGCGSGGGSTDKNNGSARGASTAGGGAPKKAPAALILQADTICGRVNARVGATQVSSPKDIARTMPALAALERAELAELRKLQVPPELTSDWNQILAGVQALARDTATFAHAAKKKDLTSAQAELAAGEKIRQQAIVVAKRDGFNDCSHMG
jgi:hypothetical protein